MPMSDSAIAGYVDATAKLLGVPLDEQRAQRVVAHLQRTAAMAALLDAVDMAPEEELAEVYSPAAFPPSDGGVTQL